MTRPVLTAVVALAWAAQATAFPRGPIPPVKFPPSPVIKQLLPYVGYVPVPVGTGHTPKSEGSHNDTLKDALQDTRAARRELADRSQLHLEATGRKIARAIKTVTHFKAVATSNKNERRAERLEDVLKDLRTAHRHVADHRVDPARESLARAASELDDLIDGKKNPPRKKDGPKKKD